MRRKLPSGIGSALKWRFSQWCWMLIRNLHTSTRQFWVTVLDVLLLMSAAFIVGTVQARTCMRFERGSDWDLGDVPANVTMAYLVQAVLNSVVHLRVFTVARNVQRHECELGVSVISTYTASVITDLGWIALAPAIYYAVYHFVVVPRAAFGAYYIVGEFKQYMSYRRMEIAATYYDIGVCNMDRQIGSNGDDEFGTEEALAFMRVLRTLNARSCDRYFGEACGILFGMGLA
ncbi:hypothetical protein GPECTOR_104g87 [Gonium pectorale]|uniref:ABC transporter family G domain-containing protein n=1 Tax=Gonium pectorale TaxID=33097 RepID=A0A150FZT0_GONPE|nr:hypothetical protein GPECTOR_104g87 [Gonium pectorale]|eukprot:KXZ43081.1 hypothetical protein GPECTOR_104g87 [Gonium pectorale]